MKKIRQKASDVFKDSSYVFSSKTSSFDKAFPEIDSIKVEVEQSGDGVSEWNRKSTYNKEHFPGEYIDCKNPLCYNGGFSIGEIIRNMIMNKKTSLKDSKLCQGSEGSAKGRRIYRKCLNFFKVDVNLKYVL